MPRIRPLEEEDYYNHSEFDDDKPINDQLADEFTFGVIMGVVGSFVFLAAIIVVVYVVRHAWTF